MGRYPTFEYRCGHCGVTFEAPVVLGGYGDLGARSVGLGTLIHIRALDDPVFEEVSAITREVLDSMQVNLSDRRRGAVAQAGFSVACDPDRDGSSFVIGHHPHCPSCGSSSMDHWEETLRHVDLEVPGPTHEGWASMALADRRDAVAAVVGDELSA